MLKGVRSPDLVCTTNQVKADAYKTKPHEDTSLPAPGNAVAASQ